jgi:predicted glycosyltransferase involved in capsule biosynthesis
MKIDLLDTTFIIPIRINSIIRLENFLLTIENLESNFDTNIIVVESSYYHNKIIESLINKKYMYLFLENKDPVFYRTYYLNKASSLVETNIIGIWDADVILEPIQIINAVEQIRLKKCDVAYPYDGNFLDISSILRNHFYINRDIEFLKKNKAKMNLLYSSEHQADAVGGAFLASTIKYRSAGSENELFYGWGPEDGERYARWEGLGFTIYRSPGCLFHLSHPRDINGGIGISVFSKKFKNKILKSIAESTKQELEEFIMQFNNSG